MIIKMFLVNTFADGLFSGGRTAVVVLRNLGQEVYLQALASELALPVTIYILPDNGQFMVRYFTVEKEINESGYGALAAGHVIYATGLAPADQPIFLHGSDGLRKIFRGTYEMGTLMSQILDPMPIKELNRDPLIQVLGLPPAEPFTAFFLTPGHLVLCFSNPAAMENVIELARLKLVPRHTCLTFSAPLPQFGDNVFGVNSYFSDSTTINMDLPVFDLHAALVPYWAEKLDRTDLEIQHQTTRTCQIWASMDPEGQVIISGRVNTVLKADPVMEELSHDLDLGMMDEMF